MGTSQQYVYNFNINFNDFILDDNITDFYISEINIYDSIFSNTPILSKVLDQNNYIYLNNGNTTLVTIDSNINLSTYDVNTFYFEIKGKYGASSRTPLATPKFEVSKLSLQNSADIIDNDSN